MVIAFATPVATVRAHDAGHAYCINFGDKAEDWLSDDGTLVEKMIGLHRLSVIGHMWGA